VVRDEGVLIADFVRGEVLAVSPLSHNTLAPKTENDRSRAEAGESQCKQQ
jgi:hypothetical protein